VTILLHGFNRRSTTLRAMWLNDFSDASSFQRMKACFSKIKQLRAAVFVALLSCGGVGRGEADSTAQSELWWRTEQSVVDLLLKERKDLVAVVRELNSSTPASTEEAMRKLNVFLRAGLWSEAIEAVDQLHAVCPELANNPIQSIYYSACDGYEAWEVAQRVVETFADNISELPLESRLLKHFAAAGWSVDAIDKWLAARPAGRDGFWMKERLRFNVSQGRADKFIKQLSAEVRANPENIAAAIQFLDAVLNAGSGSEKRWDLSWMADTIHPKRASDAQEIARRLQRLHEWAPAAAFFRGALEIPLSAEEVRKMQSMIQAMMPGETIAANFIVQAKEGLSECLLELGNKAEAQRLMEEAVALRRERNLPGNMLLAGRTQAATGARTIESAIREEQKKSEDDPRYWLERAAYYRGRKEAVNEEEAYRKALGLTAPKPRPERPGKGFEDLRSRVISDLDRFLTEHQREDEAVALLLKELQDSPAEAASTERAARLIAFEHRERIAPDEDTYWRWLSDRPTWDHTEERLLWELLQRVEPPKLDSYLSRAEKMSANSDPSRNKALGWIMNRMNRPARSIPLLEDAVARLADKERRDSAQFTLFESYLGTGHWQRAEAAFPDASRSLTCPELPSWQGRIAVAAARAGAKQDALRIWKVVANVDPCYLGSLDDLAGTGLATELRAFYGEFSKRLPTSVVPARALKVLSDRKAP
jgi:tetratricopeptide (TPR) repeat protein